MQALEQLASQIRGARPRRHAQLYFIRAIEIWQHGQYLRHLFVECEILARAVCGAGMRGIDLQRRRDMRVYPEGPERVIQVKDDESRKRQ